MQNAMGFLMKSGRAFNTQVTVFPQGREPATFTIHFKNWGSSEYCSFDSAELYKVKSCGENVTQEPFLEAPVQLLTDNLEASALTTKPVKKPRCLSKIASPKVPEALAKKRARYAKLNAQRETQKAVEKAYNLSNRREFMDKARAYASEYEAEKRALVNNKKAAKAVGNYSEFEKYYILKIIKMTEFQLSCLFPGINVRTDCISLKTIQSSLWSSEFEVSTNYRQNRKRLYNYSG